jgi:Asp-tRNA(Asn)/Glu-tRNA(Gln) amidotransferase A subunit family amidase
MSASTRDRLRAARPLTDQVHWAAMRAKGQHTLSDIDALLPTTRLPALAVEIVDAFMEMYTAHDLHYFRHTAIDNVLNLCDLSVPCGFTSQGFPLA